MNPALRIGAPGVDVAFIVSAVLSVSPAAVMTDGARTVKAGFRCEPRLTIYRRRMTGVVWDVLLGGATSSIRGGLLFYTV